MSGQDNLFVQAIHRKEVLICNERRGLKPERALFRFDLSESPKRSPLSLETVREREGEYKVSVEFNSHLATEIPQVVFELMTVTIQAFRGDTNVLVYH